LTRSLRLRSVAARFLGLWVRIPPGAWTFVSLECCELSGIVLVVGLITRPEESYRVWCVLWVWSRSPVRWRYDPESGRSTTGKKANYIIIKLQAHQVRIYYLDALFYINISTGLKNCPSVLDNAELRVAIRYVTHKICTSARCVKAENSVSIDVDIFGKPVTDLLVKCCILCLY